MDGKKWGWLRLPLLAALALLVGRASILGSLFPFGIALVAAGASLGLSRQQRWLLAIFVVVGTLSSASVFGVLYVLTTLIIFDFAWRLLEDSSFRHAPALAVLATATAGIVQQMLLPGPADAWLRLVTDSLLTGLLTYAYSLGLALLAEPPRLRAVAMGQVLAVGLLLLTAVSGLGHGPAAVVSVRNTIGAYLVMLLAHLGGAPLGAAMGAAFGLVAGLGTAIDPQIIGLFAFAGLAGGIGRELGKWGTPLTFVMGHMMLVHYTGSPPGGLVGWEALSGGVLLLLTPAPWLTRLGIILSGASPVIGDAASPQLQVSDGAAKRLHELAQVFGELGQAFDQAAAVKPRTGRDDEGMMAAIFAAVSERACQGCPLHQTCWQEDIFPTYSSLRSLWARVELDGPTGPDALTGPLRRRCLRPDVVTGTVNYLYDLLRVDRFWEQRVSEARVLVAAQLKGVAQIMEKMADEVRTNLTQPLKNQASRRSARFAYRAGVSRLHKTGSSVSGDSYLIRPLEDGRLLVALSDGMGAGVPAALESRATVTLLERLMETGFGASLSIQTVNSILLLRSPEEKFATMDLAVFDLWQGQCELIKIGAAPSYIKSGTDVHEWRAPSVPAGILQQIDVESVQWQFASGDVLIMMSDGLLAARGGHSTAWIQEFLASCPAAEPQVISESLLSHALDGQQEVVDDMTVIVLQLTEQRAPRLSKE